MRKLSDGMRWGAACWLLGGPLVTEPPLPTELSWPPGTFIGAGAGRGQHSLTHDHMVCPDQSEASTEVTWSLRTNQRPHHHTLAQESRRHAGRVITLFNHEIVSFSSFAKYKEQTVVSTMKKVISLLLDIHYYEIQNEMNSNSPGNLTYSSSGILGPSSGVTWVYSH